MRDSFGRELNVGDYIVFTGKTRYIGSLSVGKILSLDKGVSLIAINTCGRTIHEVILEYQEHWRKYCERGGPNPSDYKYYKKFENPTPGSLTTKVKLVSASSAYKIETFSLPPGIIQALEDGSKSK